MMEEKTGRIIKILKEEYPNAKCTLKFNNNFELLIATRLSARCTDKCVNRISPILFNAFPNFESLSTADLSTVEKIIKPCGLFKTKARNILEISKLILIKYNSIIPDILEKLVTLPGIGRKSANLILAEGFNQQRIIVDTHVKRVTYKLGLHFSKNPDTIESELEKNIPEDERTLFCHRILAHARTVCFSFRPKCEICKFKKLCYVKK